MKIKDIVHPSLKSEKLENLMNYCQENKVLFVDRDFPPEKQTLIGNPTPKDYNGQFDVIEWKRSKDLFGEGQYDVFKGIEPKDIIQGSLGNCYFLCSLASLAEYPDLIRRLFDFDNRNQYGIHSVWLNINGVWQRIILDEYFPSYNNGRKWDLAFSKTDQKELWVILLEKAYAKAYGSYWEIIGGDPVHALRDLTGAPYDRIEDFSDLDKAWTSLKEANTKQYMITCFTKSSEVTEEQSTSGLVSGHAYTILDVANVIDSRGQPARIIKIRNPWGKFEWKGDFSDESSLWTPQLKQQYGVSHSDDGIFWMRLEDFIKDFEGIGILEIIPGAVSNGIQVDQTNKINKAMARLSVPRKTHMMLSIDQIDSRVVDNPQYSYSYFRVTIGKLRGKEAIDFVDSVLSPERNIFLENSLEAGDYIVLVESYWATDLVKKFNLGTYSEDQISMELLSTNESNYNKCEWLVWKEFAKKHKSEMSPKDTQNVSDGYNQAQLESFQLQKKSYANILYSYFNNSSKNAIHQEIKFVKNTGFDPNARQFSKSNCDMIINPSDNDILLFKMDPRASGFSLSFQPTSQEVIPNKFTEDVSTYEVLKNLGGSQPTPDNPNPKISSRTKLAEERRKQDEQRKKLDVIRKQKMAERKKLIEQKRRQQEEERKRQEEFFQKRGGFGGGGMFSSFFGEIMQDQQTDGWGLKGNKHKSKKNQGGGIGSLLSKFGFGGQKSEKNYQPYQTQQQQQNQEQYPYYQQKQPQPQPNYQNQNYNQQQQQQQRYQQQQYQQTQQQQQHRKQPYQNQQYGNQQQQGGQQQNGECKIF